MTTIESPGSQPHSNRMLRYSTQDFPLPQREEWLREVIGREYAEVEITPPADDELFNEMTIYSWADLRLSWIRSNPITLEKLNREPFRITQDGYVVVIPLSGSYRLRQYGREVFLKAGDLALYDATAPHRIDCPRPFSKVIVSIPRPLLRQRIPGVESLTAMQIPGNCGIGGVTANFLRSTTAQAGQLEPEVFNRLSMHALDLLTIALTSIRSTDYRIPPSRAISLNRIKEHIEHNLSSPDLNTQSVSQRIGLSPRYINRLFQDENTSLMRYILKRRLENCRLELIDPSCANRRSSG